VVEQGEPLGGVATSVEHANNNVVREAEQDLRDAVPKLGQHSAVALAQFFDDLMDVVDDDLAVRWTVNRI
jgi:hypothetical protein